EVPPNRLYASDIRPERLDYLTSELGIQRCDTNRAALERGEVAVIAVKPQDAPVLLRDMQAAATPGNLIISVAAGVRTTTIEAALPPGVPVVRVMPNTPAFVLEGMAVLARGQHASLDHEAVARRIFECVGRVQSLPESKMDA